jgi:hypothetical protein
VRGAILGAVALVLAGAAWSTTWAGGAGEALDLWAGAGLPGRAALAPGVEVAAAAHPCAGCHGWDGSGGGEGAVLAPDLGRGALIARGYDAAAFADALTRGIAPEGRPLDRAMPRYDLHQAAIGLLWDLTLPLEAQRRAGVDAGAIRLALVHDPALPAARGLAEAYLRRTPGAEVGVWGRRVEIVPVASGAPLPEVFAVIGPFSTDPALRTGLAAAQVPMLHGFGAVEAPGAALVPLGLDAGEELALLARRAREAGIGTIVIAGGAPEHRQEAARALRRAGLEVAEPDAQPGTRPGAQPDGGAGVHRPPAALLLTSEAALPPGLIPILPRAVRDRRPDLSAGPGAISVDVLPFLAGAADPAEAYARASLDQILAALRAAGPDPTRWRLVEAARRERRRVLGLPRRRSGGTRAVHGTDASTSQGDDAAGP